MKTFILLFLLVSCATSYQPKGFNGGYTDQRLAKDLFRVTFKGNSSTDRERVNELMLKRCAEITLDSGYSHFVVVDGSGVTDQSHMLMNNGMVASSDEHTSMATIKLVRNPPQNMVAYDAEMIFGTSKKASLPSNEEIDQITAD